MSGITIKSKWLQDRDGRFGYMEHVSGDTYRFVEYSIDGGEPIADDDRYWTGRKNRTAYHRNSDSFDLNFAKRDARVDAVIENSGQRCYISGRHVPRSIAEVDHIQPAYLGIARRFPDGKIILFNPDGTYWNGFDNVRIVHPDEHLKKSRLEISESQTALYKNGHRNPESYGLTAAIQKLYGTGNHTQAWVAEKLGCSDVSVNRAMKRDLADYANKCGVDLGEQNVTA